MFVVPSNFSRRDFLARMGTGFGALALSALARQGARASETGRPLLDPLNPFAPRLPAIAPRAQSVIFLFMVGGPSHVDTFDRKPLLQKLEGKPVPDAIRKAVEATRHANVFKGCKEELMASPYQWAQHGQSGMWPEMSARPPAGRARCPFCAALRHAGQGRLGCARRSGEESQSPCALDGSGLRGIARGSETAGVAGFNARQSGRANSAAPR